MLLTVRANVSLNIRCQSSRSSRQTGCGVLFLFSPISPNIDQRPWSWPNSLSSCITCALGKHLKYENKLLCEEPRVPSTDLDWFVARFDLRYVPRKYSYIVLVGTRRTIHIVACAVQQLRWNENAKLDWVMGKTVHTTDPMVLSGCNTAQTAGLSICNTATVLVWFWVSSRTCTRYLIIAVVKLMM